MILFAILLFALIALVWLASIAMSLLVAIGSAIAMGTLIVLCVIGTYVLIVGSSIKYLTENMQKGT